MTPPVRIAWIGAAIVAVAPLAFYCGVGVGVPLSLAGKDWAVFGEYFGGVVGPLLSFLSVVLVISTINQQGQQIAMTARETRKQETLQFLANANSEIRWCLSRKLAYPAIQSETVELGDIECGIVEPKNVNPREFSRALERLLKAASAYCAAISISHEAIGEHPIMSQHHQGAENVVSFLKQHIDKLSESGASTLNNCENQLRGRRGHA